MGAVAQLVSLAGLAAGLAVGVLLIVVTEPHLHGTTTKTIVAIALLIAPSSVLASAGRHLGYLSWNVLRKVPIVRPLDAAGGILVAVAGTLIVCWLFASVLVNSALPSVSAAISNSRIVRGVQKAMPPVPDYFASIERYLTTSGFPQVLVNIVPEKVGPVSLPAPATVSATVTRVGSSVLKVVAFGCGDEQEGSSFAVADDLVATNAHVIAGTTSISVHTSAGTMLSATPVYFDPRLDLALLRLPTTSLTPLTLDANYVERGTQATVLGYPDGGPFTAKPAGVLNRFLAQGRDIYANALTDRLVYELEADVQPGNSGGPLVAPNGEVLGVVFSRSAVQSGVGYALASPPVLAAVTSAEHNTRAVSTEGCTS